MREMVLFFLAVTSLIARTPAKVAWQRTPEVFAGKVVAVQLSTGARVRGQWVSTAPDTFQIAVEKTSDSHHISKGLHTYPRNAAERVWVGEKRVRGRVTGVTLGALAPYAVIIGAGAPLAGVYLFASVPIGYYLGKRHDYSMQEVVLVENVAEVRKGS